MDKIVTDTLVQSIYLLAPKIAAKDIRKQLIGFLALIQAPDDYRGFIRVMDAVVDIGEHGYGEFYCHFGFSSPVYHALCDTLNLPQFDSMRLLKKKAMGQGWCNERPLYALLFSYHRFQDSPGKAAFVAAFIEQYLALLKINLTLSQGQLALRLKESCDKFRLLMQSCESLRPANYIYSSPLEIAALLREDRDLDSSLPEHQKSYMSQLAHFFAIDWREIKGHAGVHMLSGLRTRGRKRPSRILGDPDLLIHFGKPSDMDEREGFSPDDTIVLPETIEDTSMPQREVSQLPFVSNITSKQKKDVAQHTLTRRVRRQYNRSSVSIAVISPRDLSELFTGLENLSFRSGDVADVPKSVLAMSIYLSLVLGKSIDDLCELSISTNETVDGITIDKSGTWWLTFSFASPVRHSSRPIEKGRFEIVSDWVQWTCPKSIQSFIERAHKRKLKNYRGSLLPREAIRGIKEACQSWLSRWTRRKNVNANCQMIEDFLQLTVQAEEDIDPTTLDFAFRNTSLITRSTRHYSYYRFSELANNTERLWQSIYQKMERDKSFPADLLSWTPKQIEGGVGSSFLPTLETQSDMVAYLSERIIQQDKAVSRNLKTLLKYHNDYVTYTGYLILYSQGYRAVYNPLPTLAMVLPRYRLMVISDKDNSDYAHTRLVCLPTILEDQLTHYTRHLLGLRTHLIALDPMLGRQLSDWIDMHMPDNTVSAARHWFREHKNARNRPGPLFYFADNETSLQTKVISPKWLKAQLPFSVPVNAGRHNLRSYLLRHQVPTELINFQLGHWLIGQAYLGEYSCFDYQYATDTLIPILDEMLEERGWQSIPSLLA